MSKILLMLALGLPSVVCFAGAVFMAYRGNAGWGWLMFAGVIIAPIANPDAASRILGAATSHEKDHGT